MNREKHPNFELVKANMETALGGFFTALYRDPGWLGGYSADIDDFFWNMVVPVRKDPETSISKMKEFFDSFDRTPTLYAEEKWLEEVKKENDISGLKLKFTDAWMRFEGQIEEASDKFSYVRVSSDDEKDRFIEIFVEAFGGEGGEDEPYGGLGEGYNKGVRNTLEGFFGADRCENILVENDGESVGIATLAIKGDLAFVYNIATLPSHQGLGIGTSATRKILEMVEEEEVNDIVLQTEADSYVQKFYEDLGFNTIMRMKGLTGL